MVSLYSGEKDPGWSSLCEDEETEQTREAQGQNSQV